jgi:CubicO group peptidase (beta-lactamase class C family)
MNVVSRGSRLLAPVVVVLVGACGSRAAHVNEAAIDALVRKTLACWHVPGVAVGIVQDGKVIYLKGHGRRAQGCMDPISPDTLFPIASCTKSFTTTAMAALVDEGKMAWDDPVKKHLGFFHLGGDPPLPDKLVTLRDLVCHRTGLRSHDLLWYRAPWDLQELVKRAGRLPLDKPFKTAFQYQSTMFTAAGLAVASAAGTPWEEVVRSRLLSPLGMTHTVFTSTEARKAANYAFPHRLGPRGDVESIDFYPLERPDPAGSLHASARDLVKWLDFQLGEGTVDGRRIVSAKTLAETHTPQIEIPMDEIDRLMFPETKRMSYGMGWVILDHRGVKLWAHAGAIDGFRAHFTLVPEHKIGIVLLNNLGQTKMNLALSHSLLDLLLNLPPRDWNKEIQAAVRKQQADTSDVQLARRARQVLNTRPSRERAAYAGTYEHAAYGTAEVTLGPGGQLMWQWRDFRVAMEHFHFDTFTLPIEIMDHPEVVFTLDAAGVVMRMRVLGNVDVEFRRVRP